MLRETGHHVDTAGSGPEALRKMAGQPYDLMFCDLGMRDMSGWEVIAAVRANDSAIGVVLLTGWGATLSEERVNEYGVDAVLSKPFEMKRILSTVQDVLEKKSARDPLRTQR
jgi:CheY-like chemotaxis protein